MLALRPARLPEGAVLIVRRLAMRMDVGASHAPVASRVLDDLLARAARPVLAPVPAAVPAVLFADAAELLACLTRDVLQGRFRQRWYWQQIDGQAGRSAAPALGAIWQQHAPAAPAAILLLAAQERRGLVTALGDHGCNVLTRALAAAFAVDAAGPVPHRPDTGPLASGEHNPRAGARVGDNPPPLPAAPWQPWVEPATVAGLAPDQVFLLGFGLALAHAPAYARQCRVPAFGGALAGRGDGTSAAPRPLPRAGPAMARRPHPQLLGRRLPARSTLPCIEPMRAYARSLGRGLKRRPLRRGGRACRASQMPKQAPPHIQCSPQSRARLRRKRRMASRLGWPGSSTWSTSCAGSTCPPPRTPADSTRGWAPGPCSTRWRACCCPQIQTEAVQTRCGHAWPGWTGGRRAAMAGRGYRGLSPFRLPAAWVQRWLPLDRPWTCRSRGRLRLADTARGVLIADVPLAGRSLAVAAAAEIDRYRAAGVDTRAVPGAAVRLPYLPATVRAAVAPGLGWWLRRADGFVRYVIARQLRCAPHDLPAHLAGLCRRRGWVTTSRTHVDLYLSMEQVDMAARRSGLDQDPGWAPDFGRIITFHFA